MSTSTITLYLYDKNPVRRHAALTAARMGTMRRVYALDAWRAGNVSVASDQIVVANWRIGAILRNRFRGYFGGAPTFVWSADGRMGEAWDDRGNRVAMSQVNELPGWRGDGQAG